jgi:hypothetical protein
VNALVDDDKKYLATATAGVLFFGTPHRGSKDASWARIIANIGRESGLGSDDGIIKDLEEEAGNQIDLLHQFSCWLRRMSVEVVCFFELEETNYTGKIFLPGLRRDIVSYRLYSDKIFTNSGTGGKGILCLYRRLH